MFGPNGFLMHDDAFAEGFHIKKMEKSRKMVSFTIANPKY